MKREMKRIPYEIVLYVLKEGELLPSNVDSLASLPLDKTKATTSSYSASLAFSQVWVDSPDKLEKCTVKNTGLRLEIPSKPIRFYKGSEVYVYVYLLAKEFEKFNYKIKIPVPMFTLIELISKVGYVSECVLSGTFSLSGTGIQLFEPILEDREVEKVEAANRGKLLATSKRTTKWIPGHCYLLPVGATVLYLGTVVSKNLVGRYSSSRTKMSTVRLVRDVIYPSSDRYGYCTLGQEDVTYHVYIRHDFNFNKIKTSDDLYLNMLDGSYDADIYLSQVTRSAIDLGSGIFLDQTFDLSRFLYSFCRERILDNNSSHIFGRFSSEFYVFGLSLGGETNQEPREIFFKFLKRMLQTNYMATSLPDYDRLNRSDSHMTRLAIFCTGIRYSSLFSISKEEYNKLANEIKVIK